MNTIREKERAEAVKCLELMGVRKDIRDQFEKDGTVMFCDGFGNYKKLSLSMEQDVCRLEEELNATIYLVVRKRTLYGTLDAMLFVGPYEEEWEMCRDDIRDGYAMSYCFNLEYPECSEMGSISFYTTDDGGVIRIS